MFQFRHWIWLPLICVAGAMLWLSAPATIAQEQTPSVIRKVRSVSVRRQPTVRTVKMPGVLKAHQRAKLTFTVGGRVAKRLVEEGDKVEKGQLVAILDRHPYDLAKNQAASRIREIEARLRQATSNRSRVNQLLEAKAVTQEEWEQTQANYDGIQASLSTAQSALAETKRQMKETELRAPYAGEIVATFIEADEFATPGQPILTLSGSNGLEMEVQVPESMIGHLKPGGDVKVEFPLLNGYETSAMIHKVGGAAEAKGLFALTVRFSETKRLRAGLSAIIHLNLEDDQALAVPVTAVINPGGSHPLVYQILDGRMHVVKVTIHGLRNGWVSISGPLAEGDRVIVGGHTGFIEGDLVEEMP